MLRAQWINYKTKTMEKLIKKCQAYLRKKKIETVKKDNQIQISIIVKIILQDKTPKQSIELFKAIEKLYNEKLDEQLKTSLEAVTEIGKFKNIEQ